MTRKMQDRNWLSGVRTAGAALAVALVAGVMATPSAQAQFKVLYTFTGGTDGAYPYAGLILDTAGNLYGTTAYGGGGSCTSQGCGVVFELDSAGNETTLHSFAGGAPGEDPFTSLIRDASGNLYGMTVSGGIVSSSCQSGGCGVVFKLSPAGNETVLYSFTGGADGDYPAGGLVGDAVGNLYGATSFGGDLSACGGLGCGVVFQLDPAGNETVLYTFTGGLDGGNPNAGLVRDAAGNLYGTTFDGGRGSCYGAGSTCGVVFKLDPARNETVMYSFSGGADGADPVGGLTLVSTGDLYGTAADGGMIGGSCSDPYGCGVVFKLDPAGNETVMYTFTGGADGETPGAGVTWDKLGNLYGTTLYGGAYANGTIFHVSPAGKENVLYSFTGGADGSQPRARLVAYKCYVYGTTVVGGAHPGNSGFGVVFSLREPNTVAN